VVGSIERGYYLGKEVFNVNLHSYKMVRLELNEDRTQIVGASGELETYPPITLQLTGGEALQPSTDIWEEDPNAVYSFEWYDEDGLFVLTYRLSHLGATVLCPIGLIPEDLFYEWTGACPKCHHSELDYVGQGDHGWYGYDELYHCPSCATNLKLVTTSAHCVVLPEGEVI
jgi:hypothetical protein